MLGLPPDVSVHGHEVDGALRYLTWATALCFGAMTTVFIVTLLRDRSPRATARYLPGHDRWNYLFAGGVALVLFIGVDLISLARSLDHLRQGFWAFPDAAVAGPAPFRVEVTAQQWSWTFRYPGDDGMFGTADDVLTLDELRVPLGRPVLLQLRAQDVVHSFYLPHFRTKVDAIPGHVTRLWFAPAAEGTFEIACSQHCGVGHYRMRAELRVMQPDPWRSWFARAVEDTKRREGAGGRAAAWNWSERP